MQFKGLNPDHRTLQCISIHFCCLSKGPNLREGLEGERGGGGDNASLQSFYRLSDAAGWKRSILESLPMHACLLGHLYLHSQLHIYMH